MRIYLASRYKMKEELRILATQAKEYGIDVTSRWLNENEPADCELADVQDSTLERYANIDLVDIEMADVFVLFTRSPYDLSSRHGRMVEFGFALARLKPILIVGPKENIFCYLRDRVRHFDTWQDALNFMTSGSIVLPSQQQKVTLSVPTLEIRTSPITNPPILGNPLCSGIW